MAGEDSSTGAAAAEQAPAGLPLELPLHALARSLQLQHGLRHGDYLRYRSYCTRRLRRLRLHAKLTHSHGGGGGGGGGRRGGGGGGGKTPAPFQAKELSLESLGGPSAVTQEHLLLALLGAERAWALAMQLKQDHAGGKGMPSHVRSHVVRRLRKAVSWASALRALVAVGGGGDNDNDKQGGSGRATERTVLEAEAYGQGMEALLALEQERWEDALQGLRVAHSILSRFAEMPGASLADQDLFALKADEALHSMRYCQFHLGQGDLQELALSRDTQHLPPALQDKLEAALAEGRREQVAASSSAMAEVVWGAGPGATRIPVAAEGVRVALLKLQEAREAAVEKEGDEEQDEAAFAAVFGAYGEALQRVQGELARVEGGQGQGQGEGGGSVAGGGGGPRAEAQRAELRLLQLYLQHGRLQTTMRRTQGLIARLQAGAWRGWDGEKGREAELVHLYETLGQGAGEATRLLTAGEHDGVPEDVLTLAQAEEALFRAHRALHLAQFYAAASSAAAKASATEQQHQQEELMAKALALFDLTAVLAEEAEGRAEDVDPAAGEATRRALGEEAARLKGQAKGGRLRAHAQTLLALSSSQQQQQQQGEEEALAAAMATLSLAAAQQQSGKGNGNGDGSSGNKSKPLQPLLHRTLLERLGELDGGREVEGFGIARVPPTGLAPVRAKPPLFDMAYNFFLDDRLPDLALKAGRPPSKQRRRQEQTGGGGGGLFGWLRG